MSNDPPPPPRPSFRLLSEGSEGLSLCSIEFHIMGLTRDAIGGNCLSTENVLSSGRIAAWGGGGGGGMHEVSTPS